MRDNGNREQFSGSGGHGQIKPVYWVRTEHQISSHESFAPESVLPREPVSLSSSGSHTMRLASPPPWTQRDDLPCTKRVPKGNQRDPYDESDPKKAKALCAGCPVTESCLADALAEERGLGERSRNLVRGALTPKERAELTSNV